MWQAVCVCVPCLRTACLQSNEREIFAQNVEQLTPSSFDRQPTTPSYSSLQPLTASKGTARQGVLNMGQHVRSKADGHILLQVSFL